MARMIPTASPALPAVDIPESVEEDEVAEFEVSADPVDDSVDLVVLAEEIAIDFEEDEVL